jgi:hypothetical protein
MVVIHFVFNFGAELVFPGALGLGARLPLSGWRFRARRSDCLDFSSQTTCRIRRQSVMILTLKYEKTMERNEP